MPGYVALFRAVNVGGTQPVKMDALKAMHEALGLRDVATYIQSGNVVFTSDEAEPAALATQITAAFADRFGFRTGVIVRSAEEWRAILDANPFQHPPEKATKWIAVTFLAQQPSQTAQDALRKSYVGPEEIHFAGKEMYVYYPDGMGRSKLTNVYIERKLKTTGTARNWNTVLKLWEMLQGRD